MATPTALRGWLSANEGGPEAGRLLIVPGNGARMSTPDDTRPLKLVAYLCSAVITAGELERRHAD
jgi:hypothetical protein